MPQEDPKTIRFQTLGDYVSAELAVGVDDLVDTGWRAVLYHPKEGYLESWGRDGAEDETIALSTHWKEWLEKNKDMPMDDAQYRPLIRDMYRDSLGATKNSSLEKASSVLDYPRPGLAPEIWGTDGKLLPWNQTKILDNLFSPLMQEWGPDVIGGEKMAIVNIFILGSLTSFCFQRSSDLDCHCHLSLDKLKVLDEYAPLSDDEVVDKVNEIRKKLNTGKVVVGETHVVEYYFEIFRDMEGKRVYYTHANTLDGLYDVLSQEWIKPPRTVDQDYDPEAAVSVGVRRELQDLVEGIDVSVGKMERTISDVGELKEAIAAWPPENQELLLSKVRAKIAVLEEELGKVVGVVKKVIDDRHMEYVPLGDANVKFKYLQKYHYISLGRALEELIKERADSPEELVEGVKDAIENPEAMARPEDKPEEVKITPASLERVPYWCKPPILTGKQGVVFWASLQKSWVDPDGKEFFLSGIHETWAIQNSAMLKEKYGINPDGVTFTKAMIQSGWLRISKDGMHFNDMDASESLINQYFRDHEDLIPPVTNVDTPDGSYSVDKVDLLEHGIKYAIGRARRLPGYMERVDRKWTDGGVPMSQGIYKTAIKPTLYLSDHHARLIWEGKKSILVKAKHMKRYIGQERYLASREKVYGIMVLEEPELIKLEEFDRRESEHMVTEQERMLWWPTAQELYMYPFKFTPFRIPREWHPLGIDQVIDEEEEKLGRGEKEGLEKEKDPMARPTEKNASGVPAEPQMGDNTIILPMSRWQAERTALDKDRVNLDISASGTWVKEVYGGPEIPVPIHIREWLKTQWGKPMHYAQYVAIVQYVYEEAKKAASGKTGSSKFSLCLLAGKPYPRREDESTNTVKYHATLGGYWPVTNEGMNIMEGGPGRKSPFPPTELSVHKNPEGWVSVPVPTDMQEWFVKNQDMIISMSDYQNILVQIVKSAPKPPKDSGEIDTKSMFQGQVVRVLGQEGMQAKVVGSVKGSENLVIKIVTSVPLGGRFITEVSPSEVVLEDPLGLAIRGETTGANPKTAAPAQPAGGETLADFLDRQGGFSGNARNSFGFIVYLSPHVLDVPGRGIYDLPTHWKEWIQAHLNDPMDPASLGAVVHSICNDVLPETMKKMGPQAPRGKNADFSPSISLHGPDIDFNFNVRDDLEEPTRHWPYDQIPLPECLLPLKDPKKKEKEAKEAEDEKELGKKVKAYKPQNWSGFPRQSWPGYPAGDWATKSLSPHDCERDGNTLGSFVRTRVVDGWALMEGGPLRIVPNIRAYPKENSPPIPHHWEEYIFEHRHDPYTEDKYLALLKQIWADVSGVEKKASHQSRFEAKKRVPGSLGDAVWTSYATGSWGDGVINWGVDGSFRINTPTTNEYRLIPAKWVEYLEAHWGDPYTNDRYVALFEAIVKDLDDRPSPSLDKKASLDGDPYEPEPTPGTLGHVIYTFNSQGNSHALGWIMNSRWSFRKNKDWIPLPASWREYIQDKWNEPFDEDKYPALLEEIAKSVGKKVDKQASVEEGWPWVEGSSSLGYYVLNSYGYDRIGIPRDYRALKNYGSQVWSYGSPLPASWVEYILAHWSDPYTPVKYEALIRDIAGDMGIGKKASLEDKPPKFAWPPVEPGETLGHYVHGSFGWQGWGISMIDPILRNYGGGTEAEYELSPSWIEYVREHWSDPYNLEKYKALTQDIVTDLKGGAKEASYSDSVRPPLQRMPLHQLLDVEIGSNYDISNQADKPWCLIPRHTETRLEIPSSWVEYLKAHRDQVYTRYEYDRILSDIASDLGITKSSSLSKRASDFDEDGHDPADDGMYDEDGNKIDQFDWYGDVATPKGNSGQVWVSLEHYDKPQARIRSPLTHSWDIYTFPPLPGLREWLLKQKDFKDFDGIRHLFVDQNIDAINKIIDGERDVKKKDYLVFHGKPICGSMLDNFEPSKTTLEIWLRKFPRPLQSIRIKPGTSYGLETKEIGTAWMEYLELHKNDVMTGRQFADLSAEIRNDVFGTKKQASVGDWSIELYDGKYLSSPNYRITRQGVDRAASDDDSRHGQGGPWERIADVPVSLAEYIEKQDLASLTGTQLRELGMHVVKEVGVKEDMNEDEWGAYLRWGVPGPWEAGPRAWFEASLTGAVHLTAIVTQPIKDWVGIRRWNMVIDGTALHRDIPVPQQWREWLLAHQNDRITEDEVKAIGEMMDESVGFKRKKSSLSKAGGERRDTLKEWLAPVWDAILNGTAKSGPGETASKDKLEWLIAHGDDVITRSQLEAIVQHIRGPHYNIPAGDYPGKPKQGSQDVSNPEGYMWWLAPDKLYTVETSHDRWAIENRKMLKEEYDIVLTPPLSPFEIKKALYDHGWVRITGWQDYELTYEDAIGGASDFIIANGKNAPNDDIHVTYQGKDHRLSRAKIGENGLKAELSQLAPRGLGAWAAKPISIRAMASLVTDVLEDMGLLKPGDRIHNSSFNVPLYSPLLKGAAGITSKGSAAGEVFWIAYFHLFSGLQGYLRPDGNLFLQGGQFNGEGRISPSLLEYIYAKESWSELEQFALVEELRSEVPFPHAEVQNVWVNLEDIKKLRTKLTPRATLTPGKSAAGKGWRGVICSRLASVGSWPWLGSVEISERAIVFWSPNSRRSNHALPVSWIEVLRSMDLASMPKEKLDSLVYDILYDMKLIPEDALAFSSFLFDDSVVVGPSIPSLGVQYPNSGALAPGLTETNAYLGSQSTSNSPSGLIACSNAGVPEVKLPDGTRWGQVEGSGVALTPRAKLRRALDIFKNLFSPFKGSKSPLKEGGTMGSVVGRPISARDSGTTGSGGSASGNARYVNLGMVTTRGSGSLFEGLDEEQKARVERDKKTNKHGPLTPAENTEPFDGGMKRNIDITQDAADYDGEPFGGDSMDSDQGKRKPNQRYTRPQRDLGTPGMFS